MNMAELLEAVSSELREKMIDCCDFSDETSLTPELSARFFAGLKEALACVGCRAAKTFIESFEVEESRIVRNGETLFAKGKRVSHRYLTLFGCVDIDRRVFQASYGGPCHIPLDEKWGMKDQFATSEVREAVLFHLGFMTSSETADSLSRYALFQPSATAIDNILRETGTLIEENRAQMHQSMLESSSVAKETEVLAVSLDGTNMLLREPGKRKGRPAERPGYDETFASSYRNAMVGSFSEYMHDEEGKPKRIGSTYIARAPEDGFPTLKEDFEREATHYAERLPDSAKLVVLIDGAPSLWNYVENHAQFRDVPKLLDFFHMAEHLSLAAEAIFGKGADKAKVWYSRWRRKLKEDPGATTGLLSSMTRYRKGIKSKNRRLDLQKQIRFFERNGHRMDYPRFLENGWPIGSGPIEAACKTIIKSRMCRSGMRWTRTGAQRIIHLRTVIRSGRWNAFWQWHEQARLKKAS